jgi:hypothetical protein
MKSATVILVPDSAKVLKGAEGQPVAVNDGTIQTTPVWIPPYACAVGRDDRATATRSTNIVANRIGLFKMFENSFAT